MKSSKTDNVVAFRTEARQQSNGLDVAKWLVFSVFLLAALIGNYYFRDVSFVVRTLGWSILVLLAILVAATTTKGRWLLHFFRESRQELRKVVWPTKEETMQTTMVVAIMVAVLALMLWGVDGILVWLIGLLTGQRG